MKKMGWQELLAQCFSLDLPSSFQVYHNYSDIGFASFVHSKLRKVFCCSLSCRINSAGIVLPCFLYQRSIRLRATSHASLFMTSHKPSLAKIRQSSSSLARGTNITTGSGIIHCFKYLSPDYKGTSMNLPE